MEKSPTLHTLECLDENASLKKCTRLSKFEKKCDEGFLIGDSTTSKAYRVWNLASGTLEEVHDVEFDENNGSQEEIENLDDVRGTQLANAMKKMDIGDIRPREVIEVEDDKDQVFSNSNVHLVVLMIKIKLVQVVLKCKINKLVHHLMINQVQAIKCKYSNQPILQEITHWII